MRNILFILSGVLIIVGVYFNLAQLNLRAATITEKSGLNKGEEITAVRAKPINAFQVISDRPLFIKERRRGFVPEAVNIDQDKVVEAAEDLEINLLGILKTNINQRALVGLDNDLEGKWLSINDSYEGWKLVEINPENVVFSEGGRRQKIYLYSLNANAEVISSSGEISDTNKASAGDITKFGTQDDKNE